MGNVFDAFTNPSQVAGKAVGVFGIECVFRMCRQFDFELALQQFREAVVGQKVIFRCFEGEGRFNSFTTESYRDEQQRRKDFFI